jgi:hypothetical protein
MDEKSKGQIQYILSVSIQLNNIAGMKFVARIRIVKTPRFQRLLITQLLLYSRWDQCYNFTDPSLKKGEII